MAYTKKIWVNVPNASELTEEELNALIPENEEGIKQDSLARFDADNMNRIEAGIEEALDSVGEHTHSKEDVGLGNVDNTSDINKPVSTAQKTAIADAKKAGTDAQTNLNSHITDTIKHITATERTTWNGKANASHTHSKDQITGFPTSMPPTSHTHDDRYYTESEINNLLGGKANSSHTHSASEVGAAEFVTGTYNGDDMRSKYINLGFNPSAVLVMPTDGKIMDSENGVDLHCGGFATKDTLCSVGSENIVSIYFKGFYVGAGALNSNSPKAGTNLSTKQYTYIAFK